PPSLRDHADRQALLEPELEQLDAPFGVVAVTIGLLAVPGPRLARDYQRPLVVEQFRQLRLLRGQLVELEVRAARGAGQPAPLVLLDALRDALQHPVQERAEAALLAAGALQPAAAAEAIEEEVIRGVRANGGERRAAPALLEVLDDELLIAADELV